jgi:hypothetical protein
VGAVGPAPSRGAGTSNTIIQDNTTSVQILSLRLAAGKSYDFSGLTFAQGTNTTDSFATLVGIISTNTSTVRVHNMTWNANAYSTKALGFSGCIYGLVDHITMHQSHANGNTVSNGVVVSNTNCGNLASDGFGHYMFTLPNMTNSANCLFVEDSVFEDTAIRGTPYVGMVVSAMNDLDNGGCMIVRYNTINNLFVQLHNTFAGFRGGRYLEVYNNTFAFTNGYTYAPQIVYFRSGSGYIHDNTVAVGYQGVAMVYDRFGGPAGNWGQCDGTSVYDKNSGDPGDPGYACLDQPGYGASGILYSGYPGQTGGSTPRSSHNQTSTPVYVWNNGVNAGSNLANIKPNHDFFTCLDSSCAPSSSIYQTYTYPHPLTSGTPSAAPAAPTGLAVR